MTISWGIQPVLGRRRILHPGKWLPARAISWAVFSIFAIVLSFGPAMEALAHALPKEPALQFLAHAVGAGLVLGAYTMISGPSCCWPRSKGCRSRSWHG